MFFIDDDLFYEWEGAVWVLQKTASFRPGEIPSHSWRELFTFEAPEEWYPFQRSPHTVATGDGTRYIAAGGGLYSWRDGECRRLDCAVRRMPSVSAIPSGEHTFMYVDSYTRIVECDVRSGNKRFRSFPGAHGRALRDIGGGWAAFFSTAGWDGDNPTVIFWNRETDEWLPLCRGALGREGLLHIEPHTDGSVIVFTYNRLYRVFDLIGQIKALRSISVGEWSNDPEEGSPLWFIPALEAELELLDIHDIHSTGYDEITFSAWEGSFVIDETAGLWNKLHAQRKKECPTHQQIIFNDGSAAYSVYKGNPDRVYRSYPPIGKAPALTKSQAKPKAQAKTKAQTQAKPKTQVAPPEGSPKPCMAVRIIAYILLPVALPVGLTYLLIKFTITRMPIGVKKLIKYFRW
jgi:hypothetical protein